MTSDLALALLTMSAALTSVVGCDRAHPSSAPVDPSGRAVSPASPVTSTSADVPSGVAGTLAWESVPADHLCVTSGTLTALDKTRFSVDAPTFRAVTASTNEPHAQLRFTYVGPTATTRALGSGAVRQQLGLKLRAQDPCNLVYVMWRIEPEQKLVVSIKQNAGQSTSRECGNRGYKNIKPKTTASIPALTPGSPHVLRADMTGDAMQVRIDDVLVWEGSLGPEALTLAGPIGVRSDNVHLEGELLGSKGVSAVAPRACGGADESE